MKLFVGVCVSEDVCWSVCQCSCLLDGVSAKLFIGVCVSVKLCVGLCESEAVCWSVCVSEAVCWSVCQFSYCVVVCQ